MKRKPHKTPASPLRSANHESKRTDSQADRNVAAYYLAASIALITFVVYLPALQNNFVGGWDDGLYILDNKYIRSLRMEFFRWAFSDTSTAMYWHPLTWISHAVDYALWGSNPLGHHLTSIILHATNTAIAVLLTRSILTVVNEKQKKIDGNITFDQPALLITCAITGLLFGIHPLHVESVAWIAMRKDLLYSLFYMLSAIYYITYADTVEHTKTPFYFNRRYHMALLLFVMSLCSKPMAVTLPLVLLLLDWYPLQRFSVKNTAALLSEKLPFIILSCVVSLISVGAQKSAAGLQSVVEATFTTRILVLFKAVMMYAWNIIVPINLQPIYPYPKDASILKPEYLAAILLMAVITATTIILSKKCRLIPAMVLFSAISLLPVIGFFQTGSHYMADRYLYLACIGPFILTGAATAWIWTKTAALKQKNMMFRCFTVFALLMLTALLSLMTIRQIPLWHDGIVLWSHYIDMKRPVLPEFYFFRGDEFRRQRQLDLAVKDYNSAISINPQFAAAYINRGEIFLEKSDYDQAIENFKKAITLEPNSADSHINLGNAYHKARQAEQAITEYNTAIAKKTDYYISYLNRAIAYKDAGEVNKAIADFTTVIALKPDLDKVYLARGDLHMKSGVIDLAMKDYKKACELGSSAGCKKQAFPF